MKKTKKIIQKVNSFLGKVNKSYWAYFFKKIWPLVEKWCNFVTTFGEKYDELPQSIVQSILLVFDGIVFSVILFLGTLLTKSITASILLCVLIACTTIVAIKTKKEYLNYNKNK